MQTLEFRAMGSPCRVVVDDDHAPLLAEARRLVLQLEQRWSRFLPTSEVSAINANAGNLTLVSPETFDLIRRAVLARTLTDDRFNPLMLEQLRSLGYDRSWDDRPGGPLGDGDNAKHPRPAAREPIHLHPDIHAVSIPPGTALDPGGIGKGLAADMVTEHLMDGGATTTSVELGGDVRVSGEPWSDVVWRIPVANPFRPTDDIAEFLPSGGAVATSGTLRRCWRANGEQRHHLLDPATGRPARTDLVAVTASSREAWWAEVAAKVALIAGADEALDLLDRFDTPGITVAADGTVAATPVAVAAADAPSNEGLVRS
jgi:thiamine biosynthesis lipoprotein